MLSKKLDVVFVLGIQVFLIVLFGVFAVYDGDYEAEAYPMFQDVHVMIFIGFGFLMTFLRRYGYSAVGFNFLLGALIIQWALLCQGFYQLDENNKIKLGIGSLFKADIAAAAVLISMGAVLGRTSYMQLIVMGVVEIAVFSANSYLGSDVFKVADAGGSIFVHAFGAYFGLAVSYVLDLKSDKGEESNLEEARYTSDIFAMIGTIFLWLYWPSFNAIETTGDGQQRALINTYLALAACCVTTFAFSSLLSKDRGVAVGTSANLMLNPFGACVVGVAAGVVSVAGYSKLTPWLRSKLGIRDTCGVHNLHGIPAVLAGLIGTFMAAIASESMYYNNTLYEIYPARSERTAGGQAGYQALALLVTLVLAIASGIITGLILRLLNLGQLSSEKCYDDATYWTLPEVSPVDVVKKSSGTGCNYDNPSFEPQFTNGTNGELQT